MGGDSCPKVVSSNPSTVYWMDIFSHLFAVKFVMLFEKTKINEKEAGVGPFFFKKDKVSKVLLIKLVQRIFGRELIDHLFLLKMPPV